MLALISLLTFSSTEAQSNFSLKLWKIDPDGTCTGDSEFLTDFRKNHEDSKLVYPLCLSLKFFSLGRDSTSDVFILEEKTYITSDVDRVLFASGVDLYDGYPHMIGIAGLPNQSYDPYSNIFRIKARLFSYDSTRIDSAVFIHNPTRYRCTVGQLDSLIAISSSFGGNSVSALGKTLEYETTTINTHYLADQKAIKVILSNREEADNVWIYDMSGKALVQADGKTLSSNQNIIPFEYQSGLYFVRVKLGNTFVTKKILTY